MDVAAESESKARAFLLKMISPFRLTLGDVTLTFVRWTDHSLIPVKTLGYASGKKGALAQGGLSVFRAFDIFGYTTDKADLTTMPLRWTLRGENLDIWQIVASIEAQSDSRRLTEVPGTCAWE